MSIAQQKINKGHHAERLLKDPLLQEALNVIKQRCFDNMQQMESYQEDEIKAAYYLLKASNMFETVLKGYIRDGQIVASDLSSENIKRILR